MIIGRLTIRQKAAALLMGPEYFAAMFDGAPVLFGAGCYFSCIGNYAICVTAKDAIEFFDEIQVGQVVAIDYDIFGSRNPRHPIKPKTNGLVNSDKCIQ